MEEIQQTEAKTKRSKIAAYVLIGLVVGLLIFSTMQTFQINDLEQGLISGGAVSGGRTASPARSSASGSAHAVPAMVGGC